MVYGSALGSFSVERFGVERLKTVSARDVTERVRSFQQMMSFEHEIREGILA